MQHSGVMSRHIPFLVMYSAIGFITFGIITNVACYRITPVDLQQYMQVQTGIRFYITCIRVIMHMYNLSPNVAQQNMVIAYLINCN